MNTIRFTDDDPNKVYAILNLREIDFAASRWSATLLEVYDSDKDGGTAATNTFTANRINGTYSAISYVPFTLTSPADFIISPSYIMSYTGDDTITVNITASVGGNIITAPDPSTVYLRLQRNGTDINTAAINVSGLPEPFNAILTTSSVTLNSGDNLAVFIDSAITSIQISSGSISFTYVDPVPFIYDPYFEEYISN
jgi:hypothetical protein